MKLKIVSIKNVDNLKRLINSSIPDDQKLFVPTFGLVIEDISIEYIMNRMAEMKSLIPFFIERSTKKEKISFIGDLNSFDMLSNKFKDFGQSEISQKIKDLLHANDNSQNYSYSFGKKVLSGHCSYVMGVLNLTPDSFYDGGKYFQTDAAVAKAYEMIDDGAGIIDIGAESSRPGSDPISSDEELDKLLPVLRKLVSKNIIISIDTYKSKVAQVCLEEGAHIINDISGLKFDKELANVVAKYDAGLIIMHIRGTPKTMQQNPSYVKAVDEIFDELKIQISIAKEAGISKIYIDPGIGFGKRLKDNYEILNRLEEFNFLGYPIAIGLSRKSFIGSLLDQSPDERLTGTIAANSAAQLSGANIIRVHDVKEMLQVKKIINLIKNPNTI